MTDGEKLANAKMILGDSSATYNGQPVKMFYGAADMEMPLFLGKEVLYLGAMVAIGSGKYRMRILEELYCYEYMIEGEVACRYEESGANCRLFIRSQISPKLGRGVLILLMTVVAAALPQQSETLNAVMIKPGPNAIFGAIFNTTLDFEFTKSVPVPKELRGMRADQIICAL